MTASPPNALPTVEVLLQRIVSKVNALHSHPDAMRRCTDRTIADLPALHRDLGRVRTRRGVAFARDESTTGVMCVGAPIRVDGGTVAAVSLCGGSTDAPRLERCAPLVLETGRVVATALAASVQLLSA